MQTLIFLHIPKTGGRTLEQVLRRYYPPEDTYRVYGYGSGIESAVATLEMLPSEEKRRIRLIKGHFPFGLHRTLPQPSSYITLLRDPVERVISHYSYVRRTSDHPLHEPAKSMSLRTYVESGISLELNNGQARLLSGDERGAAYGESPEMMYEKSVRNIESHFSVVGIVERYDESMVLMRLAHGWGDASYTSRNVSTRRRPKQELDQETLDVVTAYNRIDQRIYEYAVDRLEKSIARQGRGFARQVSVLHSRNRLRSIVRGFKRSFRLKLRRDR